MSIALWFSTGACLRLFGRAKRIDFDGHPHRHRVRAAADDPTGSLTSQVTRGFTGQEELHDVGLAHLNGRVYDPLIARMTSADPMVPGQAWNRYSYVVNNPLAFTDPSGYRFLGLCGVDKAFTDFFYRLFNEVGRILRQTPILGTIAELGAVALCYTGPQVVACGVAAAFISNTAVAGLTSGSLGRGVQAGAIAAAEVVAFYGVGEYTGHTPAFGTPQYFENIAAHALVGCGATAASGGQCGPTALAAAVTSAAGPVTIKLDFVAGLVVNAALGGGAAVLGGGKFENGAVTSAFGYLFNALLQRTPNAGQSIDPYGEQYVGLSQTPTNAQQILQYRIFYYDTESGTWSVGFDFPASGSQVTPTYARRGPDAGTSEVGFVVSPPGSPAVVPGQNPQSSVRVGFENVVTGDAYYITYNADGQAISPVTGRTVGNDLAHYPIQSPTVTIKP
jgi:RHS repeat-associated protein